MKQPKYKTCKCKCHEESIVPCDKCTQKDYEPTHRKGDGTLKDTLRYH